jgi:hypothetical protein
MPRARLRVSGIAAQKGAHGTVRTQGVGCLSGACWTCLVSNAAKLFKARHRSLAFALPDVSSVFMPLAMKPLKSGNARLVVATSTLRRSPGESIATSYAVRASNTKKPQARSLSLTSLIHAIASPVVNLLRQPALLSTVPVTVRNVRHISGREPVYNLTVSDVHEYFANGILSRNCDSTRMVTADWGPGETAKTKEEQREDKLPAAQQLATIQELPADVQPQAYLTRDHWLEQLQAAERKAQERPKGGFVNRHRFTGKR